MKWFGENWGAPACEPDAHVATPVGALCTWCEEAIEEKDCGFLIPHVSPDAPTEDKPVHLECSLRQTLGSVGHQQKRCSCFGGRGNGDDPKLSIRENARRAEAYFVSLSDSEVARMRSISQGCPDKLQAGDKVRVRAEDGPWIKGKVILASQNGRSIAVTLEHLLNGAKGGFFLLGRGPMEALLLTPAGWQNLEGVICEVVQNGDLPN